MEFKDLDQKSKDAIRVASKLGRDKWKVVSRIIDEAYESEYNKKASKIEVNLEDSDFDPIVRIATDNPVTRRLFESDHK